MILMRPSLLEGPGIDLMRNIDFFLERYRHKKKNSTELESNSRSWGPQ